MSLCPKCGRIDCTHSLAERGQILDEMMRPMTPAEMAAVASGDAQAMLEVAQAMAHAPITITVAIADLGLTCTLVKAHMTSGLANDPERTPIICEQGAVTMVIDGDAEDPVSKDALRCEQHCDWLDQTRRTSVVWRGLTAADIANLRRHGELVYV